MDRPLLDNSLPNLEDVDEVIKNLWNQTSMGEVGKDKLVGINQWLLDGAPTAVQGESDKVSIKKDDSTIPKAEHACVESTMINSDAVQKNDISYSSAMLTPEPSPPMWYDYVSDIPTVVPVPSFIENKPAVMAGYTLNQPPNSAQTQPTSDSPSYEINGVVVSMKKIEEDIQRNCPAVVQNIKIEPLHEVQPVQLASLKPAPSQIKYELPKEVIMPQTPSCKYVPHNQLMITPSVKNMEIQQAQDFPTVAAPSTSSTYYEPISPFESADPAPGLTCAEYLSSVQFSSDCLDISESVPVYCAPSTSYAQAPPFQFLDQAATVPTPAVPTVHAIDPPASYVQVQNEYALPTAGVSIVYPVQEYYRVDEPQPAEIEKPASRKRPRKAKVSYGTEFYCNICEKEFGKKGSYQQHVRQKHQEDRPFRCSVCGKSYLTEQNLRLHRQNHETRMKPYQCTNCDKRYRHMKDRDRHFETHHGTPSHACVVEDCPMAFARRDHMLAHLISHENRMLREKEKLRLREEKENKRKQRERKLMNE